jgi:hypothetical protein
VSDITGIPPVHVSLDAQVIDWTFRRSTTDCNTSSTAPGRDVSVALYSCALLISYLSPNSSLISNDVAHTRFMGHVSGTVKYQSLQAIVSVLLALSILEQPMRSTLTFAVNRRVYFQSSLNFVLETL